MSAELYHMIDEAISTLGRTSAILRMASMELDDNQNLARELWQRAKAVEALAVPIRPLTDAAEN